MCLISPMVIRLSRWNINILLQDVSAITIKIWSTDNLNLKLSRSFTVKKQYERRFDRSVVRSITFVCPLLIAHCSALSVPPSSRLLSSHMTTCTWLFIAARSKAAVVHPSVLLSRAQTVEQQFITRSVTNS